MNKFVAVILLALAAVALSAPLSSDVETISESALNPTDTEETASLSGKFLVFSDFCLQTRDFVVGDVKQTANDAASKGFSLVFESAESLGKDVLNVQQTAAGKLAYQMAHPDAEIEAGDSEIDQIIANGQRNVHDAQIQPKSLYQAFVATIQATGSAISQQLSQRLNSIKENLGLNQVIAILDGGCDKVAEYEQTIRQQFQAAKEAVVESDPSFASVTIEQVPCVTARRIIRMEGICGLARAAQGPVKKIISRS